MFSYSANYLNNTLLSNYCYRFCSSYAAVSSVLSHSLLNYILCSETSITLYGSFIYLLKRVLICPTYIPFSPLAATRIFLKTCMIYYTSGILFQTRATVIRIETVILNGITLFFKTYNLILIFSHSTLNQGSYRSVFFSII